MPLRNLTWALGGCLVLVGCARVGSSGNSESYNQLVDKYNRLLESSYELQDSSADEEYELASLNTQLEDFASRMETLRTGALSKTELTATENDALAVEIAAIQKSRTALYEKLAKLEARVLKQATAIDKNADRVLKDPTFSQTVRNLSRAAHGLDESLKGKSKALNGIRRLVETQSSMAEQQWKALRVAARKSPAPLGLQPPAIQLTQKDEQVVRGVAAGSSGFARTSTGTVQALKSRADIEAFAKANGFDTAAALDASRMSTGGLVSFAPDSKQIPSVITDMVSHIKPALNKNAEDLEIAFVVDYSGSMSDDIEAVIKGLVEIAKSFENVKLSGRNVKIAVVSFGMPGHEKLEMALSSDMVKVAGELERLLTEFSTKSHSTDPGEASYHGLQVAAEQVKWTSKNRMAIVVTDEPSYELQKGDEKYVRGVMGTLAQNGVDTHIYTIVVK